MTKKQWVTCQHQLPVTTPHSFPGSDTEFPPCSGFRIGHYSAETSRGQHSAAHTCWVQSTPGNPDSGCLLNKDHQLSPHSVPDIVENPMNKWRLQQDHLFYIFKIETKFHHFMNETGVPETCPYLPTCPPGALMEQVTESSCLSPAFQPGRGFIQIQLLFKTPMSLFPVQGISHPWSNLTAIITNDLP